MFQDKEHLVSSLFKRIPNSINAINMLDFSSEQSAVRFNCYDLRFRVSLSGLVEQVEGHFLVSNQNSDKIRNYIK